MYSSTQSDYLARFADNSQLTLFDVDWQISFESVCNQPLGTANIDQLTDNTYVLHSHCGALAIVSADFKTVQMKLIKPASPYYAWISLSSLLRMYLSLVLPYHGGMNFHASSVISKNGAYIFLGESGAGKSTICTLAGDRAIFNDEMTLVTKTDNQYEVCPSPFFSSQKWKFKADTKKPLKGVLLLTQATQNYLEPVKITKALPKLMACLMNFVDNKQSANRLLDVSLDLLDSVDVFELGFTKSEQFWQLLES